MKAILDHKFEEIIAVENLLGAWSEFIRDKRNKQDVLDFRLRFLDNLHSLHNDLKSYQYQHGGYFSFGISDPKPRRIHKATVRDRLLHHAIHRKLYPFFDRVFIPDSFSCRLSKGTHKALDRFTKYSRIVSENGYKTCWILKCDIKKFFANIDHKILIDILAERIKDADILWLLQKIICSFETRPGAGLPLGNLTSQLFVNIYMNEFDRFVKHEIRAKYYIRYADDFVIFSKNKHRLERILPFISDFLRRKLKLELHPDKLFIKTLASGVDFLGWVHFPNHRILRTTTRWRMLKNFAKHPSLEVLNSYLGLLRHGDAYYWQQYLLQQFAESRGELCI